MIDDPVAIGRKIAKAKELSGKTWRQIAQDSGLDEPYLHKIRRGEHEPGAIKLAHFAEATGVTMDWLLGRVDETSATRGEAPDAEAPPAVVLRFGYWMQSLPRSVQKQVIQIGEALATAKGAGEAQESAETGMRISAGSGPAEGTRRTTGRAGRRS